MPGVMLHLFRATLLVLFVTVCVALPTPHISVLEYGNSVARGPLRGYITGNFEGSSLPIDFIDDLPIFSTPRNVTKIIAFDEFEGTKAVLAQTSDNKLFLWGLHIWRGESIYNALPLSLTGSVLESLNIVDIAAGASVSFTKIYIIAEGPTNPSLTSAIYVWEPFQQVATPATLYYEPADGIRFTEIQCNRYVCLVKDDSGSAGSGKLYSFGYEIPPGLHMLGNLTSDDARSVPTNVLQMLRDSLIEPDIDFLPSYNHVLSFSIGYRHSIALIDTFNNGSSYTTVSWGDDSKNQTGCSANNYCVRNWQLPAQFIKQVVAGYQFSLVLDVSGAVWHFGSNSEGMRGQIADVDAGFTELAQIPNLQNIAQISTFDRTCFALDTDGFVWSWGGNVNPSVKNDYSLLGTMSGNFYSYTPRKMLIDQSIKVHRLFNAGNYDSFYSPTIRMLAVKMIDSNPTPSTASNPGMSPPDSGIIIWGNSGPFVARGIGNPSISNLRTNGPTFVQNLPSKPYTMMYSNGDWTTIVDPIDGSLWQLGGVFEVEKDFFPTDFADDDVQRVPDFAHRPINTAIDGNITKPFIHYACTTDFLMWIDEDDMFDYLPKETWKDSQFSTINATGITKLLTGSVHAGFIKDHELYLWAIVSTEINPQPEDYPQIGPSMAAPEDVRKIELFDQLVLDAALGHDFTIVYVDNDTAPLWSFGDNADGQLGNASVSVTAEPVEVSSSALLPLLVEGPLRKIVAGYHHTLILTRNFTLYGFGNNELGQLGPGDPIIHQVSRISGFGKVVDVSCLQDTTYVLLESSQVMAFGKNFPGNLFGGVSSVPFSSVPVEVPINQAGDGKYVVKSLMQPLTRTLDDRHIMAAAAIRNSELSEPTPIRHTLYGWGDGYNRVPSGNPNYISTQSFGFESFHVAQPVPVFPRSTLHNLPIKEIKYNVQNGFALTTTDQLWVFGNLEIVGVSAVSSPEPVLIATEVSRIETFYHGVLYLLNNGTLRYYAGTTRTALVTSFMNTQGDVSRPTAAKVVSFSCNGLSCVVINELGNMEVYGAFFSNTGFSGVAYTFEDRNYIQAVVVSQTPVPGPLLPAQVHFLTQDLKFGRANLTTVNPNSLIFSNTDLNIVTASQVGKLIAGSAHVLMLRYSFNPSTSTLSPFGSIWGWGSNSQGQLDLALDKDAIQENPIRLYRSTFGERVRDIAAVDSTSIALMDDGRVFQWGFVLGLPSALNLQDISLQLEEAYKRPPQRVAIPNGLFVHRLFSCASINSGSGSAQKRVIFQPPDPVSRLSALLSTERLPSRTDCTGNAPGPNFMCEGGRWIVVGNVTATPESKLVISGPSTIDGNLLVNTSSSIAWRLSSDGTLPLLNVSGCAELNATVSLEFSESELSKISSGRSQKILESNCRQSRSLQNAVQVSAPKSCRKVSANSSEQTQPNGRVGLIVILTVNSSACNRWWIVLVSVVGGVLLIGAIVTLVLFKVGYCRQKFQPYRGTN